MKWFVELYLGDDGDPKDPRVSPIYADDLSGLPPALVITAEFDPLRDEGEAYGTRLQQARVAAKVSRYDGMIHGSSAWARWSRRPARRLRRRPTRCAGRWHERDVRQRGSR